MSRGFRRATAILLVGAFAALVPSALAGAQDEDGVIPPAGDAPTLLRAVDTTDTSVGVLQMMHEGSPDGLTLTQEGTEVTIDGIVALAETRALNVVFVVDTGATMDEEGGLQAVREGLPAAISAFGPDDQVAVVSAGDSARVESNLTTSRERVAEAVESLVPSPDGGAAIWTGIRSAGSMLSAERAEQPNVVVLTSAANINDGNQQGAAVGQMNTAGAAVFVQGFGSDFSNGSMDGLTSLTEEAGGTVVATSGADAYIDGINEITRWLSAAQWSVTFTPVVVTAGEIVESEASVGDFSQEFAYVVDRFDQGAQALQPFETEGATGLGALPIFQGSLGRLVMVLMVLFAVTGIVWALASIFGPNEGRLSNVLMPYSEGYAGDEDDEDSSLAKTALLKRAVSITEGVAERQGYLSRTEAALERADLPLRAAEALFFYVAAVVLVAILGLVLFQPMGALILALAVVLIPPAALNFKAGMRKRQFNAQLPDMLQLLAGTLRAGYSLMQGVEAVSQEVTEPMGKELRRVVTESRLGRPLEEALDGIAERMASPDFAWAVMAIRIQREVGGNLSELLMTVADTMIARERLRRDIAALTAEGRVSALVLGILPVGLGLVMFALNPEYMGSLFDTTLGNILLGVAIVSMLIGFAWMRQIIKIEI
jgi:tight adherence protein B